MKKLLKSVFVLGASQVATTSVGLVRNKLLAVLLGPEGVGLFGMLQQTQSFLAGVIPMGMETGALRYLAKYRVKDASLAWRYMATASKTFAAISVFTVAACLVFVKPLAAWAIDDADLYAFLLPPIAGIPFLIQTTLWAIYLRSGLEFKTYSKALVMTSVTGLVLAIPIVVLWRMPGAAVHLLIVAVIGYAFMRGYAMRTADKKAIASARGTAFDWTVVRNLGRFAGANVIAFALTLAIPFLFRAKVIQDCGLAANGILQAVMVFYSQLLGMVVTTLTTYNSSRISQMEEPLERVRETNATIKAALFLNVPLIVGILLFRDIGIGLLFDNRFAAASALFPFMMIAAYFRVQTFVIGSSVVLQERFRARNIMSILQSTVYVGVFYAAPPQYRLQAVVWAEAANWTFTFLMTYGYQRWLNRFGFSRENWRLSVSGLAVIVFCAVIPMSDLALRLAGLAAGVLWVVVMFSRDDRAKLMALIRKRMSRSPEPVQQDESENGRA